MFKIYLAVAHKGLEDFLESNKMLIAKKLNDEVDFVGTAVYREGIIQGIKDYYPDVVIVREGVPGSLSLSDLVYQIKIISPSTRIIFIAGDRKPGDAFLATLVQYGVYDILIGNKVNVKDMIKRIIYPNKMADVIEFMPKIRVTDNDKKQLYEAPDLGLLKPILEDKAETANLKPLDDIIPEEEPPIKQEIPSIKQEESSIQPPVQEELVHKEKEDIPVEIEPEEEDEPILIEDEPEEVILSPVEESKPKRGLFGRGKKEDISKPNNINLDLNKPEIPTPPVEELPPIIEQPVVQPVQQIEEPVYVPPAVQPIAPPIEEPKIVSTPPVFEQPPVMEQPHLNESQKINVSLYKEPEPVRPLYRKSEVAQNPYKEPIQPPVYRESEQPITPIVPPVQTPVTPSASNQIEQPHRRQMNTIPNEPVNQNPYVQNGNTPLQPTQSSYNNQNGFGGENMFTPRVNVAKDEPVKKGIFGKKTPSKTVAQQIITFCGGRHGCGNSQIAFNTALHLAEQGFKVLYMDLDEEFSSIDAVFEFGLEDLGVDSMLRDIAVGNYPNLINAISSAPRILSSTEKGDSLYKIFSKFPSKLELACFSVNTMYKKAEKNYDVNLLKELNMFLLMNMNYDMIIMDAPSNVYNELTQIALIYSNRIMFTITQDIADVDSLMRSMRAAQISNISYREKSNIICNKHIGNAENSVSSIQNQVENYLRIPNVSVFTVPNVAIDVINASASQVPLLWKCKDKNFKKSISNIANLILN